MSNGEKLISYINSKDEYRGIYKYLIETCRRKITSGEGNRAHASIALRRFFKRVSVVYKQEHGEELRYKDGMLTASVLDSHVGGYQ